MELWDWQIKVLGGVMWKANTKEGKEVSELNTKWNDVKDNISEMLLLTKNGQTIYLPKNMESYIQYKTASAELGSKNIEVESRTVGFKIGNSIVKIKVNEKTSNINLEIE